MAWSGDGRMRCVMNQLLEMERSLNNFMLETVLKLETLTQTKVFLLLESKHYRRYGGSPELVACFEESNFLLNEKDEQISVEVQLETADILHETRRGKRKPSKDNDDHSTKKDSSPSKKSRSDDDDDDDDRNESRTLNGNNDFSGSNGVDDYQPNSFVKRENDLQYTEDQMHQVYDHLRRSDPLLSIQSAGGRLSSSTGHLAPVEDEEYFSDGYADGEDANQRVLDNATDPAFRPGMYSLKNVRNSRKYRELESVEDVTLAYVKGTREFRLLGSTLYDIGKEIGLNCPILDVDANRGEAKQYLNAQMQEYLPLFERFKDVEKRPFRDVLKTQTPESYMKNRMRCGFVKARPNYYKSKPKTTDKKGKKTKNQPTISIAPSADAHPQRPYHNL